MITYWLPQISKSFENNTTITIKHTLNIWNIRYNKPSVNMANDELDVFFQHLLDPRNGAGFHQDYGFISLLGSTLIGLSDLSIYRGLMKTEFTIKVCRYLDLKDVLVMCNVIEVVLNKPKKIHFGMENPNNNIMKMIGSTVNIDVKLVKVKLRFTKRIQGFRSRVEATKAYKQLIQLQIEHWNQADKLKRQFNRHINKHPFHPKYKTIQCKTHTEKTIQFNISDNTLLFNGNNQSMINTDIDIVLDLIDENDIIERMKRHNSKYIVESIYEYAILQVTLVVIRSLMYMKQTMSIYQSTIQ
ncbi:hypothetical protein BATDEDRAFT_26960 [Batrachochytrium dendrobatidis JAM81]|uniref:Uncharacterized protein n=1 Tax=Batrachochytrium dendrobatidis (strain JAM81 / FGSC 10211) TaxID=684364 RepID=F4P8P8_BATDJ|nr:uncharacterized protein BATDEDRAFT_26960 [Batrachochytrium dendrobatidis JAM81]EGF78350.1 hypothetical protein BATDEDRAFT_26960 [Batrachochytrium dendrobatidis JAM81]|eukprot:XP_006681103.1 hypothetical protein BATDEDRAFT_26960 [Batrachochytrium dendrobatidis JAM81]